MKKLQRQGNLRREVSVLDILNLSHQFYSPLIFFRLCSVPGSNLYGQHQVFSLALYRLDGVNQQTTATIIDGRKKEKPGFHSSGFSLLVCILVVAAFPCPRQNFWSVPRATGSGVLANAPFLVPSDLEMLSLPHPFPDPGALTIHSQLT